MEAAPPQRQYEQPKTNGPARRTESRWHLKTETAIGRLVYPEPVEGRPRTRADCDAVPRPCPYVGCRHHLGLEVLDSGAVKYAPNVDALPYSCSLDIAEHGGVTLDQVAQAIGVTRERVRQIEIMALAKAQRAAKRMDLDFDELVLLHPEGWPEP